VSKLNVLDNNSLKKKTKFN